MKPVRPWWKEYNLEIIGSIVLHVGLFGLLSSAESCIPEIQAPKPVTKISVVSLGSVKKSKIPDRATRAHKPKPAVVKPPTKSTQEMTLPKEKVKPKPELEKKQLDPPKEEPKKEPKEEPKENSKDREELLRKLQREQLLQSLSDAPIGKEDREETSQEGTEETLPGMPSATPTDPILSAYIVEARNRILPNWAPLPTLIQEHPEYEVIVQVEVLADGRLMNPTVIKKSGDASFDKAAIRAIYKTGKLPPPPEKWRDSAAQGILITLAAADKT